MTERRPRLAIYLLNKFAADRDGEAMVGDALERYTADRDRLALWRQVASIIAAQTFNRARTQTSATLAVVFAGWFAYWASARPATELFRIVRGDMLKWLAATDHYTQAWVFWSSMVVGNAIAAAACFAIGWTLARLSRDRGVNAVALFALSMVVLEGGALSYFLANAIANGRTDMTVAAFAPLMWFSMRPVSVMLGGLLGSKTAEPIATG